MPKPDFHTVELNKTEWEVPKRYSMLSPVGSGAYGQVWWVAPLPYSFLVLVMVLLTCIEPCLLPVHVSGHVIFVVSYFCRLVVRSISFPWHGNYQKYSPTEA